MKNIIKRLIEKQGVESAFFITFFIGWILPGFVFAGIQWSVENWISTQVMWVQIICGIIFFALSIGCVFLIAYAMFIMAILLGMSMRR